MKKKLLPVMVILAGMASGVGMRASLAEDPGQHMQGPPDGAYHRRFQDADKWPKEFDNPERTAWQKPEEVLDALHLVCTSKVADIGAGTGYFSVRIARHIPDGKIFAADIELDMVRYLAERAHRGG